MLQHIPARVPAHDGMVSFVGLIFAGGGRALTISTVGWPCGVTMRLAGNAQVPSRCRSPPSFVWFTITLKICQRERSTTMFRRLMRERRVAFYAVMAVKAGEKYELGGMMVSQVRQEGECVEKKTELLRRRTGRERTRLSSAESECNDFHLHLLSALFSCVTFPYLC